MQRLIAHLFFVLDYFDLLTTSFSHIFDSVKMRYTVHEDLHPISSTAVVLLVALCSTH